MQSRLFSVVPMVLLVLALFPMLAVAGPLDPPGPPAPTMKTLDQIPPTWDQVIPNAADRFKLVMGGAAVLDKETGLVWERVPETSYLTTWQDAISRCIYKPVGGRKGWRLATIEELSSLVDPGVASPGPTLPVGHPFGIGSFAYWSSTTVAGQDGSPYAWVVSFNNGTPQTQGKAGISALNWCVRGGRGHDGQ